MTDRRTAILGTLTAAIAAATGTSVEAKKKKKKCKPACAAYASCKAGKCKPLPIPSSYVQDVAGAVVDSTDINYGPLLARGTTLYVGNKGTSPSSRHSVLVFSANESTGALTFVRQFGTYGTENDQVNDTTDMTFAGDFLLVVDSAASKVKVWRVDPTTGVFTANQQLGSTFGTGTDQFTNPEGIAYSATHGKVYVIQSYSIKWFDFNTTTGVATYSGELLLPAEAYPYPRDAVLLGDALYCVDRTLGLLKITINSDGTVSANPQVVTAATGDPAIPGPTALGYKNGRFYISNEISGFITQIFNLETDGTISYVDTMNQSATEPYQAMVPRSTEFIGQWAYVSVGSGDQKIALFEAP